MAKLAPRSKHRDARGYDYVEVALDDLKLDPENNRIEPQTSSLDAMIALIDADANGMFALARDIVAAGGTNPAELPNVTRDGERFVVREANRRITAQKLLHNPDVLRGRASDREWKRWKALAETDASQALPKRVLVVVGKNHDAWVDRRHLGPQGGAGLLRWNHEAKRRRAGRRARGGHDFPVAVLDALKREDPGRFTPLMPPNQTFTTFARILEDEQGRERIGVSIEAGRVRFRDRVEALHLLEGVLRALQLPKGQRLTSRTIHRTADILKFLNALPARATTPQPSAPDKHSAPSASASRQDGMTRRDQLRDFVVPKEARIHDIIRELERVRKGKHPNASMILVRVALELSLEKYCNDHQLRLKGDRDTGLEAEIKTILGELHRHGIHMSKEAKRAINYAGGQPVGLSEKLHEVVKHLGTSGKLPRRDVEAIARALREQNTVHFLNDAVHRLHSFPTMDRVNEVLDIIRPIFNAVHS